MTQAASEPGRSPRRSIDTPWYERLRSLLRWLRSDRIGQWVAVVTPTAIVGVVTNWKMDAVIGAFLIALVVHGVLAWRLDSPLVTVAKVVFYMFAMFLVSGTDSQPSQPLAIFEQKRIRFAIGGKHAEAAAIRASTVPATGNLLIAVSEDDLDEAGRALHDSGWAYTDRSLHHIDVRNDDRMIRLVGLPGAWGRAAIDNAQRNRSVGDFPTLTPHDFIVWKVVTAGNDYDELMSIAEIVRQVPESTLNEVRTVIGRWFPSKSDRLEELVRIGRALGEP